MERRYINPLELSVPRNYTHVVVTTAGRTVHVSGQVAYDGTGRIVGKDDLRAQIMQVFENVKAALVAADAGFADVVKMNTYIVDLTPEKAQVLREVRAQYVQDHPPASTTVGVTSLVHPDLLVEIEVVATLPDRR
jgi:enamine deaminase RidA (YjgF/YER057c/UK114 family)